MTLNVFGSVTQAPGELPRPSGPPSALKGKRAVARKADQLERSTAGLKETQAPNTQLVTKDKEGLLNLLKNKFSDRDLKLIRNLNDEPFPKDHAIYWQCIRPLVGQKERYNEILDKIRGLRKNNVNKTGLLLFRVLIKEQEEIADFLVGKESNHPELRDILLKELLNQQPLLSSRIIKEKDPKLLELQAKCKAYPSVHPEKQEEALASLLKDVKEYLASPSKKKQPVNVPPKLVQKTLRQVASNTRTGPPLAPAPLSRPIPRPPPIKIQPPPEEQGLEPFVVSNAPWEVTQTPAGHHISFNLRGMSPSQKKVMRLVGKGAFAKVFDYKGLNVLRITNDQVDLRQSEKVLKLLTEKGSMRGIPAPSTDIREVKVQQTTPRGQHVVPQMTPKGGHVQKNYGVIGPFYPASPNLRTSSKLHQRLLQKRLGRMSDICYGVAHAHQNGIAHRDIKPDNIRNNVLIDWGIAAEFSKDHVSFGGTPYYFLNADFQKISKIEEQYGKAVSLYEQLKGAGQQSEAASILAQIVALRERWGKLAMKADIAALGLTLYEKITDERFPGEDKTIQRGRFLDAKDRAQATNRLKACLVPKELITLILDMLNDDPDKRPTSKEVSKRLDQCLRSFPNTIPGK